MRKVSNLTAIINLRILKQGKCLGNEERDMRTKTNNTENEMNNETREKVSKHRERTITGKTKGKDRNNKKSVLNRNIKRR